MNAKPLIFVLTAAIMLQLGGCSDKGKLADAYGTFEATEIILSSEVSGKLLSFNVEEGMLIKKGDTLGHIDSTDWVLKKLQLYAQRKAISSKTGNIQTQAEVQRQQKENLLFEKNRLEKLLKDGAATQKQMDDIKAGIALIEKQIEAVEAQNSSLPGELESIDMQIAQIDQNIKRCKIIAPQQGTVLSCYAHAGEIALQGKALLKIADLSEMILRVYVSGAQLPNIKVGDKVEVRVDKNEKEYRSMEGKIIWISSQAEFTPKTIQTKEERVNLVYAVKVAVVNDGTLKIGMPGEIKLGGS